MYYCNARHCQPPLCIFKFSIRLYFVLESNSNSVRSILHSCAFFFKSLFKHWIIFFPICMHNRRSIVWTSRPMCFRRDADWMADRQQLGTIAYFGGPLSRNLRVVGAAFAQSRPRPDRKHAKRLSKLFKCLPSVYSIDSVYVCLYGRVVKWVVGRVNLDGFDKHRKWWVKE